MSEQTSTFNTAHVLDNEIVKASDFEFAFESLVNNVAKFTQMILESTQDFVINGKVVPSSGMTVNVSPIFGVCKTTGIPFGRTKTHSLGLSFEIAESGRIDIIEVQGDWKEYDTQQRAFNDPDTNTQTYQYVETKKLAYPNYRIKQGVAGSGVAPEHDAGWVKLAEIVLRPGASSILESDIKNITSDVAGLANTDWTYEEDVTYNIGYISEVNARFREAHNEDGTHKENCIDLTMIDVGIGTGQVNGNVLPVGATVNIPNQTVSANDSILSVLTKTAAIITTLYNAYLQYDGAYKFNGDVSVSDIADPDTKVLSNPIVLHANGDGTAQIKIGANAVISIDANGKLSTNGYTATANNHLITKVITDALASRVSSIENNITYIMNNIDPTSAVNKGLSKFSFGTNLTAATTTNITLVNSQTIDGVVVSAGDLVLVKDQTNLNENGIYEVSNTGSWSRGSYNIDTAIAKKFFVILNGTSHKGSVFVSTKDVFDVDGESSPSNEITFEKTYFKVTATASSIPFRDTKGLIRGGKAPNNNVGTPTNLRNISDQTILANIALLADVITPIGFVYVQYPQQKSPVELGLYGTWKELIQYNGAFFRSTNAPTTLYGTDGINFYKDADLTEPVDDFSVIGTVTQSGTTTNTQGNTVNVYTADWTIGNADNWLKESDSLVAQKEGTAVNGLNISTVTLTGDFNHDPTHVWTGSATGIFSLTTNAKGYVKRDSSDQYNGKRYLHIDATHSHTLDGDNETRPKNYTVRIWKRVS